TTVGFNLDPLGNFDGVQVAAGADGNLIGNADGGNLITSNRRHGVVLGGAGTRGNTVQGNYITANPGSGVVLGSGASANVIGGLGSGESNVITANGTNGVGTAAGGRNLLRGNAIYENGALGIDVDFDGMTFAHLVWLTAAATSGTDTTVEGLVLGAPN